MRFTGSEKPPAAGYLYPERKKQKITEGKNAMSLLLLFRVTKKAGAFSQQ